MATRHGVCRTTVQGWRNQLTELVRTFMGADVLHLIQRTPQWRENLTAIYLDHTAVARMENNSRFIRDYEIVAIAKCLRVPVSSLFPE